MGGIIIAEILKSRPEIFKTAKQILIQPMSSIPELRENLFKIGYEITDEYLAKEDKKIAEEKRLNEQREKERKEKEAQENASKNAEKKQIQQALVINSFFKKYIYNLDKISCC